MAVAFIDISLYQVAGADAAAMTIPANAKAPDFAVARTRGVRGVIARACNDVREDPSCRLFIPAARGAGLDTAGYAYIRPPRGSALLHADRLLAAIDASGGTSIAPMVDMEAFDGQDDWKGNRYVDWVLEHAGLLHAKDGRVPLGYGGKWFLDPMTAPRQLEVVAAFESVIVPAYSHQPAAWPQQQWPLPPVDPALWEQWARSTQGGDPGLPNGPTLPTGVQRLEAWQLSSMGDTSNYGWPTSHHLDLNVATDDAWARWTAPLTTPEVPPVALINTVPTHGPVLPSVTRGQLNGSLDPALLRNFDGRGNLLKIVSYGMQALHLAAWNDQIPGFAPIDTETVGRYRSYEQQVNLFNQRMVPYDTGSGTTRTWNGKVYWLRKGMAQVATPRTSNHGWGSADDVAEERTGDHVADGMSDHQLTWMRDNAEEFGFGLESRKERWHWCWIAGDQLPQRAVEVLRACGIAIDLPGFDEGQTQEPTTPTTPEIPSTPDDEDEDDMKARRVIKPQSQITYYGWSGEDLVGIPNDAILKSGVDNGLYQNAVPDVWSDADFAALLEHQPIVDPASR